MANKMIVTTQDFKNKWTDLELLGVKATVNASNFFAEEFNGSTATDSLATFYTSSNPDDHAKLNVQENEFSMDGGESNLSHFALTHDHRVVAVCFDADEEYVFYRVG